MTKADFLQRLGQTEWRLLDGAIVRKTASQICPAMYVCGRGLAWKYSIDGVDRCAIFAAADNKVDSPYFDPAWRRDLLQACGLAGEA